MSRVTHFPTMFRPTFSTIMALTLLVACSDSGTNPLSPHAESANAARVSGPSDPTATWKIPVADAGLGLRSDGQFTDGTYSVYADGVCGVKAKIFATTQASNSGDATIQTSAPKGGKCGRRFTLSYPDGYTETLPSFNNLHEVQNTTFSIPIGATVNRRLVINPGVLQNNPSRCGRLIFGPNAATGAGSDSVQVTRIDARTWQVQSQASPSDLAHCENNGQLYSMRVNFVIVSSSALP